MNQADADSEFIYTKIYSNVWNYVCVFQWLNFYLVLLFLFLSLAFIDTVQQKKYDYR